MTGVKIEPQPDCCVCGTGIHICALHEPQVEALMTQRGIDEFEASEILRQQFAEQEHGFLKTA